MACRVAKPRYRGFRQIAFSYRSPDFGASLGQVRDTLYKFSFPNGSDFCRCRVDAAVSLASVDEGVNVPFLNKVCWKEECECPHFGASHGCSSSEDKWLSHLRRLDKESVSNRRPYHSSTAVLQTVRHVEVCVECRGLPLDLT